MSFIVLYNWSTSAVACGISKFFLAGFTTLLFFTKSTLMEFQVEFLASILHFFIAPEDFNVDPTFCPTIHG